ncbi:hypothetical protein [Peptoniphilus sp. oral taxon 386]|uniref:hypothetical protein n=1 Tax=Peptoniphilus sp. oral taxon 386 TaxID=652713 RepID=UPI0001DA99A1|nr:hypothetical protein [Peptoniphilus sp. oral taxon 386]EFI41723.1 hypothetical protein HMPREF0629_00347 [Peptoniphilus sp. oral taxon 386 str. F0131]
MKKRDLLLNTLLIALICLTIFQIRFLWFNLPDRSNVIKINNEYNPKELFTELLKPQKMIANFGEERHSVIYVFDDLYREYLNTILNIFIESKKELLTEISAEEYMKLQENRSIVFKFNHTITENMFLKLLGFVDKEHDSNNVPIQEIYISNNDIAIVNQIGFFKVHLPIDKDITQTLSTIENTGYKNYKNFYELYSIEKNIYIPQKNTITARDIYYFSNLKNMDSSYKNKLAERFLNQSIDYIREITQINGSTFVYENQYLKFSNTGLIEYENAEKFESQKENLYISLRTALSFIATKTGIAKDLYLSKIELVENGNNKGYKFSFNLKEDSIPIILDKQENHDYIEMEVFSSFVKSYKQIYRKAVNMPQTEFKETEIYSIEDIIQKNLIKFMPVEEYTNIKDILKNIQDINLAYIDDVSNLEKNKLTMAININYNNRQLYFSLDAGKFLMER